MTRDQAKQIIDEFIQRTSLPRSVKEALVVLAAAAEELKSVFDEPPPEGVPVLVKKQNRVAVAVFDGRVRFDAPFVVSEVPGVAGLSCPDFHPEFWMHIPSGLLEETANIVEPGKRVKKRTYLSAGKKAAK